MTINQFIEKAIEGGWNKGDILKTHLSSDGELVVLMKTGKSILFIRDILMDPKAWESVGKVNDDWCNGVFSNEGQCGDCGFHNCHENPYDKYMGFFDNLWGGSKLEEALGEI